MENLKTNIDKISENSDSSVPLENSEHSDYFIESSNSSNLDFLEQSSLDFQNNLTQPVVQNMYFSKDTKDAKFMSALVKTIEKGIIPNVKLSGKDNIVKAVYCIASVSYLLRERYNLTWKIYWTQDPGRKNGEVLSIINFLAIFKEK